MLLLIFKVVNTELNIERFTSAVGISILTIDCLVNFTPDVYFSSRLANEASFLYVLLLARRFISKLLGFSNTAEV